MLLGSSRPYPWLILEESGRWADDDDDDDDDENPVLLESSREEDRPSGRIWLLKKNLISEKEPRSLRRSSEYLYT